MPNKVEAGMRFRRRDDGKTFTAVREWGKGRSSINGQPDWYVEEDDSHRSLSSDDLYEPIPEPAPELCAFKNCGRDRSHGFHYPCASSFNCNVQNCHPFVAPQAKPVIAKPADIYAGPPITGTFHNVQAKPVLREPKPRADGYPDVCLECRGDKGGCLWVCDECAQTVNIGAHEIAWNARQAKPAAKDIPSAVQAGASARPADAFSSTEAARGGEAAITPPTTFRRTFREYAPSAVAAAPGIEPWRPSVDDWDLLPDAETGWRR